MSFSSFCLSFSQLCPPPPLPSVFLSLLKTVLSLSLPAGGISPCQAWCSYIQLMLFQIDWCSCCTGAVRSLSPGDFPSFSLTRALQLDQPVQIRWSTHQFLFKEITNKNFISLLITSRLTCTHLDTVDLSVFQQKPRFTSRKSCAIPSCSPALSSCTAPVQ